MKKLMLGNEAVARGLYEAGCCFVSSYPGTPSTEITEYAAKYPEIHAEWAPNEKVAMEAAFGASLAGKRSMCAMKHVGLNVAADPLFTLSYTGIHAGLVAAVADDPGMHSSQNEQDSRHYAIAAKIPMLEPSDASESLAFTKLAFDISEQFDTPVLIRMCTRVSHSQSIVELSDRTETHLPPTEKNDSKYIMMPAYAKLRHPVVEKRMECLSAYAEETPLNRVEEGKDHSLGIITSSTAYMYVKEIFRDRYPVLKLGLIHPLPAKKLKEFSESVAEVLVIEELDGVIESFCRNQGIAVKGKELTGCIDELSQNRLRKAFGEPLPEHADFPETVPGRPPVMCAGCPHRGLFYTLKKLNLPVFGDIGCYTLGAAAPLTAIDTCLCMGASVSGAHGYNKALETSGAENSAKKAVCVIGDSTFMHSGMTGLADIAYNQSDTTVLVLDNSITGMTGHQDNPTTGRNLKGDPAGKIDLEALCYALGIEHVAVTDPYDLADCERVLREETGRKGASVVISRRPCALLKHVKHPGPISVDPEKCVGCRSCMKIGCPAISISGKKAVIDATQCTGCRVCAQLCKMNAI